MKRVDDFRLRLGNKEYVPIMIGGMGVDISTSELALEAARLRLRPILMTTLAALFGAIPLMLASGSGAELRQPLGLVMVGGLLVSQVLTLFTTPVIYLAFDRTARRWSGKAPAKPKEVGA